MKDMNRLYLNVTFKNSLMRGEITPPYACQKPAKNWGEGGSYDALLTIKSVCQLQERENNILVNNE